MKVLHEEKLSLPSFRLDGKHIKLNRAMTTLPKLVRQIIKVYNRSSNSFNIVFYLVRRDGLKKNNGS